MWPLAMRDTVSSTYVESLNAGRDLASGERGAFLVRLDGSEIDEVHLTVGAGTAAAGLNCYILGINKTQDTTNVTALPDDSNILSTTGKLYNKGGSAETLRFSFSSPKPSITGYAWVVIEPTGTASPNIRIPYTADWKNLQTAGTLRNGSHNYYIHDGLDWGNVNTLGPAPMRIKKTDGSYYEELCLEAPPINTTDHTINYRSNTTTNAIGCRFTAPFSANLLGVSWGMRSQDPAGLFETVLIDTSNNVLARTDGPAHYWGNRSAHLVVDFKTGYTLTKGTDYRIYMSNPFEDADNVLLTTVTLTGENEKAYFGLSGNEMIYTSANDPPSEGGAGSWTDTSLELPFFGLNFAIDPADLEGTGGGGGGGDPVASAIPQRARLGAS